MAGTVVADTLQAASTSTLVIKNGVANTPPTIQDSAGTQIGTFCRAWVNFNGTGTVAIRASFNVSSITDVGTGRYTINITTALPDANYSVVFGMNNASDATFIKLGNTLNGVATLTTTTVPFVSTYNYGASLVDYADIYVAIFR